MPGGHRTVNGLCMFEFSSLPALSLYIHFPWCVQKCPYCDFNSHAVQGEVPEQDYVQALLRDLEQDLPLVWGRKVTTIFMGGGTPSLFSPQALRQLISGLRARLSLHSDVEISMEANPGTVEQEQFAAFRDLGVNRLSLGIQSFSDAQLRQLGRIHNAAEAVRAIRVAKQAGFDNFNLDLMFGLPGQSLDQALADLRTAVELEPMHLSWYQLTLEPNTSFYHNPPDLPDDDLLWQMQQRGQAFLADNGYEQYEISAYAREQKFCRHNLNYWSFGDYLGIGAGAHGKISLASDKSIRRISKKRSPREYLASANTGEFSSSVNFLSKEDVVLEYMMNAFRLRQGFTKAGFETNTGLSIESCMEQLVKAQDKGLLLMDETNVVPSKQGQRYLNDLLQLFMTE